MPDGDCRCPKISLHEWRDREVSLAGHWFLARPTPLLLHLPQRFYRDLEDLRSQVDGRRFRMPGSPLVLYRDGWFSGELLLSIDPPGAAAADVRTFQNLFYSRVVGRPGFDGALRAMPRFYRDLRAAQVGPIRSMYFWYLNCPACLIARGVGQVVLLACSERLLISEPAAVANAPSVRGRFAPCGV